MFVDETTNNIEDRGMMAMSNYPRKMDEVMVAMDLISLVWRHGKIGTLLRGLQNLAGHFKCTKLVYIRLYSTYDKVPRKYHAYVFFCVALVEVD
jgi:hypothetical protein